MCGEIGFSYGSFKVSNILSKHNIKTISFDGISSLPTSKYINKKNLFLHYIKRFFKLLFFNPKILLNRFSFFIIAKLRDIKYKNTDIAIYGGNKSTDWQGYKTAKHKIFGSSCDYGVYLQEREKKKFKNKKKFAVFVDAYIPFHPEEYDTFKKIINPQKYFESLINFLKEFEKETKLEVIIALYPKADITKYPQELKKFKIISDKTSKLIEASEIVLHHGSTAMSYVAIYKKPSIFLTSNFMEKYKFVKDYGVRIDFIGPKIINIDNPDLQLLKNKREIFKYDKLLYKQYVNNYLNHKLSNNQPWFKNFNKYFKNHKI